MEIRATSVIILGLSEFVIIVSGQIQCLGMSLFSLTICNTYKIHHAARHATRGWNQKLF